jgi:hypothetical protein
MSKSSAKGSNENDREAGVCPYQAREDGIFEDQVRSLGNQIVMRP